MKIHREHNGGVYFRLEKQDWSLDWRLLISEIKRIPGWEYKPENMPDDEKWWWIPESGVPAFFALKKRIIDDVLYANQLLLNWED